jgi:hypothetical protein
LTEALAPTSGQNSFGSLQHKIGREAETERSINTRSNLQR